MKLEDKDMIIVKIEQIDDLTKWKEFLNEIAEYCIVNINSTEYFGTTEDGSQCKDIEITCSVGDYKEMLPFLSDTEEADHEMITVLKSVKELENMLYEG